MTGGMAMVATASGKCECSRCQDRTQNIYRMVGRCANCQANPILMIFRAGDPVRPLDCPVCGVWHSVYAGRLATDDEIPVPDATPDR
jgi:hypothetical protein